MNSCATCLTMSQSEAHRYLVKRVAEEITKLHPGTVITVDLQSSPGCDLPPIIDGFRPDVYARNNQTGLIIIAEAKTDRDIDEKHTYEQTSSFVNYLERRGKGRFILSVTGTGANRAKTLLRFMSKELRLKNTVIEVFDCCDFWLFDLNGGVRWHLI